MSGQPEKMSSTVSKPSAVDRASTNEKKTPYPKAVFFIVGNEFCERFSYYGMRTILFIYLTRVLAYHPLEATRIFHLWAAACYFFPVFGAIMSDSWLGKFRTIFYVSILYAIGNIVLSVGAIPNTISAMNTASMVGLGLIAIGTGGIKPCVSAFGGDQFGRGQEKQLERFFSFFYMSINVGSLFSTFLTPILREDVRCFGQQDCFPLAFGVPAILMLTSLVLFLCGKSFYRIVPAEGNVVVKVWRCIFHAISNKCRSKNEKKSHWLDYAEDKYDKRFIGDIKIVLHILVLYLPLPVFWSLFDQQSTTWVLQAEQMDGNVGGYIIKPDQMQVCNAFLIIAFIPLFQYVVYPILEKCNINKPLRKITIGGLLSALAFVAAAFVQLQVETELPVLPSPGKSDLMIINSSPCTLKFNHTDINELSPFQEKLLSNLNLNDTSSWLVKPENCGNVKETTISFSSSSAIETLMITNFNNQLKWVKVDDEKKKPPKGAPKVRFIYNFGYKFTKDSNASIKMSNYDEIFKHLPNVTEDSPFGITKYQAVPSGKYKIYLPFNETAQEAAPVGELELKVGGVYIITLYKTPDAQVTVHSTTVVAPNKHSILLQIPQFVLLTAGEIMFSITGLEFSYSQSPKSMKSVLQAAWLLTVAFGDLLVVVVTEISFKQMSTNFFMYASLMALDMMIFAIMAHFYKYVNIETADESIDIDSKKEDKFSPSIGSSPKTGKLNSAYEEETEFKK